jgi:hypothetical protein
MAFGDNEPIGINFFGGIKINAQENTASFSIGETFYQALNSVVKNNVIVGEIYGDFHSNIYQPIASNIFDPDGADTVSPFYSAAAGLED